LWKNGDGKYILLLATDGDKIVSGEPIQLKHDAQKNLILLKREMDYSIFLPKK
jgi:hypothetical protein